MNRYDRNITELIDHGRLIKVDDFVRHPDEIYITVTDRRGNAHLYRYVPKPDHQPRRPDVRI